MAPMVSKHGISMSMLLCSLFCFSTVIGGTYYFVYETAFQYVRRKRTNSKEVHELAPLTSNHSDTNRKKPDSVADVVASSRSDSQMESEELAILEKIIDSKMMNLKSSGQVVPCETENIVLTVLDATPYCNITEEQRNDPQYEPVINKTIAFASQPIAETVVKGQKTPSTSNYDSNPDETKLREEIAESILLVPSFVKVLLAVMAMLFYSCLQSFVGWLPSYFKLEQFPKGSGDWEYMGSQMVSVFFFFMFSGSVASIPCSVFVSTTRMMRVHLVLTVSGGIILELAVLIWNVPAKVLLLFGSASLGYGISAIFPLTVSLVNDYGFTM